MAISSSSSSSSRLWAGELDLAHDVLPGLAIYQRLPPPSTASVAAKGKQKAVVPPSVAAVPAAASAERRTTRSRSTASSSALRSQRQQQQPTPPASLLLPTLNSSSREHDLPVLRGEGATDSSSPPIRKPARRVASGGACDSEAINESPLLDQATSPSQEPKKQLSETTAIKKITLTIPSKSARAASSFTQALSTADARLAIPSNGTTPVALSALTFAGVELPAVEQDHDRSGFELRNVGPPADWPYDSSPTGRLHALLDTGACDGRTSRFLLVDVFCSASSSASGDESASDDAERLAVTLAVYGWAGPLETREMRLFALPLPADVALSVRPSTPSIASSSAAVARQATYRATKGTASASINWPPTRDASTASKSSIATDDNSSRDSAAIDDCPPAAHSPSSSSLAIDPPLPASSSSDLSDLAPPVAPRPSLRARLADRNRPLKDRLSLVTAPTGSGAGHGHAPGDRPGVWSQPSKGRRAKRPHPDEPAPARVAKPTVSVWQGKPAAIRPRAAAQAKANNEDGNVPGEWESRKRVRRDVRDGGVDRWRAGVVNDIASLKVPSPVVVAAKTVGLTLEATLPTRPAQDGFQQANRERLRRLTAVCLLGLGLARSHAEWKAVFGFVVRGAAFALRKSASDRLLAEDELRSAVELHASAYVPAGLTLPSATNPAPVKGFKSVRPPVVGHLSPPAPIPILSEPMDVDLPSPAATALPEARPAVSAVESAPSQAEPSSEGPVAVVQKVEDVPMARSSQLVDDGHSILCQAHTTEEAAADAIPAVACARMLPASLAHLVHSRENSPALGLGPAADAPLNDKTESDDRCAPLFDQPQTADSAPTVQHDVFRDDESDLTSVVDSDGEDDDAADDIDLKNEAEEEEWINERSATPTLACGPDRRASLSSPLSSVPSPAGPPRFKALPEADTPARRATRSSASALLNQVFYSSAARAFSVGDASAQTSPSSAPSSSAIATPPDAPPPTRTAAEEPTPRRSTRRVVSGNKTSTMAVSSTVSEAAPEHDGLPANPLDATVTGTTRRSPRRAVCASSKSLPPTLAPAAPVPTRSVAALKQEPELAMDDYPLADLGAAFEPSIGRGGEVVYLLSRRSREGTAVSSYTS